MKQGFRCGAALAALLVLAGCQAPANGQASQGAPMELKIYAVPPAQTAPLAQALGNALGGKASVTLPAPGKLLVYAPRETQSSIGVALTDLGKTARAAAPEAQVTVHFWVVDAQAGPGADDAALKPLAATLDALRQSMGPQHFQVDEAGSATVENNHQGRLSTASNGSTRTFVFEVHDAGHDAAGLSLDYKDGLWQVSTTVGARYGEYLVLAQAPGVCPASFVRGVLASSCATTPGLRLVIVRADRLNPRA